MKMKQGKFVEVVGGVWINAQQVCMVRGEKRVRLLAQGRKDYYEVVRIRFAGGPAEIDEDEGENAFNGYAYMTTIGETEKLIKKLNKALES